MKLKFFIILCLSLLIGGSTYAAKRSDRPVQIQYAPLTGAALGYHFNDYIYVGAIQVGDSENTYDEILRLDDSTHYDQIGIKSASIKEEPKQAVEIRVTPWDWEFGVHFSLGYLIQGKTEKRVEFDRRLRVIGDNAYRTALDIEIESDSWSGAVIGMGCGYIFDNGISIGLGFLASPTKKDPTISVTVDSDVTLSAVDQAELEKAILRDERYNPGLGYFTIGYNF